MTSAYQEAQRLKFESISVNAQESISDFSARFERDMSVCGRSDAFYSMDMEPGIDGCLGMDLIKRIGISISNLPFAYPTATEANEPDNAVVVSSAVDPNTLSEAVPDLKKASTIPMEVSEAIQTELDLNLALPKNTHCTHPAAVIKLEAGDTPIFRRQYPIPHAAIGSVQQTISNWLDRGYIREADSKSQWNFPLVVVPKKDAEGNRTDYRVCLDTRALNKILPQFKYPIPIIREMFPRVEGSHTSLNWISEMLIYSSCYIQIQLAF